MEKEALRSFQARILEWAILHPRPLPWKSEKDPYLIWLSEIILQQTRVEQGLPYFLKFRKHYPDVHQLANASEDEVLKHWQGLGYYSRARNMLRTARYVSRELNGEFPNDYQALLALSGVGPYTAAAIASFAFELPYAVLDGNVFRVLSRFFGLDTPIDTANGKKEFSELAGKVLYQKDPGTFNQALMDFGALQCTPAKPGCENCLLRRDCVANQFGRQKELPVKTKKLKRKERYFNYLVVREQDRVWLTKRTKKDIWQNLYEFPLLETPGKVNHLSELNRLQEWQENYAELNLDLMSVPRSKKHILTHQIIRTTFWEFSVKQEGNGPKKDIFKVKRKNLGKFALPKVIDWYLKDKGLTLNLQ